MSDYLVGFGKPPKHSRFKKGMSGNLQGRPKKGAFPIARIISDFWHTEVRYQEKGRMKRSSRSELVIKHLITMALNGDIGAVDSLLRLRSCPNSVPHPSVVRIVIENALPPDLPGDRDVG